MSLRVHQAADAFGLFASAGCAMAEVVVEHEEIYVWAAKREMPESVVSGLERLGWKWDEGGGAWRLCL